MRLDVRQPAVSEVRRPSQGRNGAWPPLKAVRLTENARTVLRKRYLRRGEDGQPVETVEEMFWRVAYHVALAEHATGRTQSVGVEPNRRVVILPATKVE